MTGFIGIVLTASQILPESDRGGNRYFHTLLASNVVAAYLLHDCPFMSLW